MLRRCRRGYQQWVEVKTLSPLHMALFLPAAVMGSSVSDKWMASPQETQQGRLRVESHCTLNPVCGELDCVFIGAYELSSS